MKVGFGDILDAHKDVPAVVCCHGPSLNKDKEKIIEAQEKGNIIRFSVNNWYDFFDKPPNYWIISNTEPKYHIFNDYKRMNNCGASVFYSIEGDPTTEEFIEKHLECDYFPYDQRHFKNHDCIKILKSFKEHGQTNKNLNFKEYGNNETMWYPPRVGGQYGWAGFDLYGRCCSKKLNPTIQEFLQKISNCKQHYSTADTVAFHVIAFAIIMGCNPIYISGLDLDYSLGYAEKDAEINMNHYTMWKENNKNLINDMQILNKSAEKRNINIINLKKDPWYKKFGAGKFDL